MLILKPLRSLSSTVCALILLFFFFEPLNIWSRELPDILASAMQGGVFLESSQTEVVQAEQLFVRMLEGERGNEITRAWNQLGWGIMPLSMGNHEAVAVMEQQGSKRGRGVFLFHKVAPKSPMALMVPHGFKDLDTDKIGLGLAEMGIFHCSAWNTRPRRIKVKGETVEQDLARIESSYFVALTRSFAKVYPNGKLIQVHGFSKNKRKTTAARKSDVIVSNGSNKSRSDIIFLGQCLEYKLKLEASVFSVEVTELGATTNISGKILRGLGHNGFIHIEIGREIRENLGASPRQRDQFAQCLAIL